MSKQEPHFGLSYGWTEQENFAAQMDENLIRIGLAIAGSVISRTVSDPSAASNVAGARYIVGPSASGVWAGASGYVAGHDGTGWVLMPPRHGLNYYCEAESDDLIYLNGAWVIK